MQLEKIGKVGTTNPRKRFWDLLPKIILASQKREGKNVAVDVYDGQGTVINLPFPERGRAPQTPTGACCIDGECSITTRAECEDGGGDYLGDNTTCDDVDCTQGACCEGTDCSLTTEEECAGTFHGYGTTCEDVNCAQGACCADGDCSISTEEDCLTSGGVYQGNGTNCGDPTICDMPQCCENAFDAFDGSGRKFLTKIERITRTAHQDAIPPTIDGCDLSEDITTTTTINPDDCSVTVTCSGTYSYVNITQPEVEFSNCEWVSDGAGGCHFVLISGEGGIGCGAHCTEECLSCTPATVSATLQRCACDSTSEFQESHLTHTIILSNECAPGGFSSPP